MDMHVKIFIMYEHVSQNTYIHTYIILKLLFHYDTENNQTTNRELTRARLTAERLP